MTNARLRAGIFNTLILNMKYFISILSCWLVLGTNAQKTLPKFPPIPIEDTALFRKVQEATFQYFWNGAEPNSGLARERVHLDNIYLKLIGFNESA